MTNKFEFIEQYKDGKYRFISLSDGKNHLRRVVCDTDGIILIPFDTSGDKIRNVYLAKYLDYLTNEHGFTCITIDDNPNTDSAFEELHELINVELGIDADVNDVYFLGSIKQSMPFSKSYKCYAINLDNYAKDLNGFTLDLPNTEIEHKLYTLSKIKLTRILKGDVDDTITMSAILLLTSYIND